MEFDTLVRHGVSVIGVMGNNGIWALEKHPMEFVYGYSVVADLRPETRYDQVVEVLGGHGELVRAPGELRGAWERSLASGKPALINVLTDPVGRLSPQGEPRLRSRRAGRPSFAIDSSRNEAKTARIAAGGFRSRFGPIGTGRGTCREGRLWLGATGGAGVCGYRRAYVRARGTQNEPSPAHIVAPGRVYGNQTFVQARPATAASPSGARSDAASGGAIEDVVLGDLDRAQAEQLHQLREDHDSGDDHAGA